MKILLFILTLISFSSHGQRRQETHLPIYFDKELITNSIDSLLKIQADEVVIIQTDKNFSNLSSPDSLITFISWRQGAIYNLKIVTADKIYKTIKFEGQKIFNQEDKGRTFVTEDELTLKFTPPLTNQNAVFYINPRQQGYFEQENPVTYVPQNKKREKLRKQWFDKCISTLQEIKTEIEINRANDRLKKLDEGY